VSRWTPKNQREADQLARRHLAELERQQRKETAMNDGADDYPPQRAVDEAIRWVAAGAAGREVDKSEVSYVQANGVIKIRVAGMTPDPLLIGEVDSILAIARNIAGDWN
jgi:hypothetical protein